MRTRRDILQKGVIATTGVTLLSGCNQLNNQNQKENQLTIPFNGLGTYKNWLKEKPEGLYVEEEDINRITKEDQTVDEQAEELAQLLSDVRTDAYRVNSLMKKYHQQREDPENQVILNKNQMLPLDETVYEIFKVKDNELQNKPVLFYPKSYDEIHLPGEKETQQNRIITSLRQFAGSSRVPEDLKKTNMHISHLDSEEFQEEYIDTNMDRWTDCILGLYDDDDIPVRPETFEDGMLVYNAKYHNGDTDAYVKLCKAVDNEEILNSEEVVEASYNGENWEMEKNPEAELDDFYDKGLTPKFN